MRTRLRTFIIASFTKLTCEHASAELDISEYRSIIKDNIKLQYRCPLFLPFPEVDNGHELLPNICSGF